MLSIRYIFTSHHIFAHIFLKNRKGRPEFLVNQGFSSCHKYNMYSLPSLPICYIIILKSYIFKNLVIQQFVQKKHAYLSFKKSACLIYCIYHYINLILLYLLICISVRQNLYTILSNCKSVFPLG